MIFRGNLRFYSSLGMEYLYEGNFFDEDVDHTYSGFSLQLSDEEESDEDRIDSDVETALYGMIHHSENPSYESFQENISTNTKINSDDNTVPNEKSIRNSNNNVEISSGVDTSNVTVITLSSDSNSASDSEDIKFLCKVRKKDSSVPEVRIFHDKCNSNTYTKKENRKWWEKFVSITYDSENINFSEEHLQTASDSSGTELDENDVLNLEKQFILNEDPWKSNSSKFSRNQNTVLNSNNTKLDKNGIFNLKKRFSINENPGESNSSKFSLDQNKVLNSDNKKLDKNSTFNLKKRFSPNENPSGSNSTKFSLDQNKVSNSNNKELDKNSILNLKKKFFSNEKSRQSDSSKFAMDQNIESDSSEDIFKTPSMSSDNISINLSSNSSGPTKQHNGIWHVNFEDLPQSHIFRYYTKSMNFTCRNCLKRGHRKKDCNQPKKQSPCFLCGIFGHRPNKCLQKVCKKCQSTGHKAKNCTGYMNSQVHCNVCQYDGHEAENCPDIWRRYHLTKDENCIVHGSGKINTKVYCYNCGRKGHFGHQCKMSRDDSSCATLPFIVKYKSSYSTSGVNNKNNNNKFKKKDKSPKLIQKKKKKKKSSSSNLAKNILSSFSTNCTTDATNQQTAENKSPLKFVQSVTDYVNLLHLPKENGKNKKQKKRHRTKTQPKEFNKKPLIIHLS